jgi:tight adherence protein C
MTPGTLLIAFFFFTLATAALAGYVFVLRPARAQSEETAIPAPLTLGQRDLPVAQAAVLDMFRLVGEALPGHKAQAAAARAQLAAAGYRWPSAVSVFLGIKCGASMMLGTAGAWAAVTSHPGTSMAFLPALCGIGFGYLLPDRILERMVRHRSGRLRRGLPAALDLMVLAVEAGQSLDASILEASRGLRLAHPELASEFTQLHLELRANPSREEALRNFATRGRDLELKKFTNLLMDTDRFGTSLGPALRTHARYLRTRFRQGAQERARKVGVKLIFPVFFLIFPSVILVTLGPAAILLFAQMRALMDQP